MCIRDRYDFTDGRMNTILPQCVVMIEEIVDQINELGRRVIFLGDGVEVFRDYINEHVKVDYDFAPAMCNKQRASAVACLGQVLYEDVYKRQPLWHIHFRAGR